MDFAEKLRELRGEITQEEIAKELGISKSAWAMYERGERVPRDEVKIRIANYFDTPIQDIFFAQSSTYSAWLRRQLLRGHCMSDLVFLAPNTREPFTTSEVIAECAQVTHDAVQKMISRHEDDFKAFGQVGFEIRAVKANRGTKYIKVYHLNEQQATLLMTYLRNTEVVRAFKMELVRQFYAMRQELYHVQTVKVERRTVRRNVTDAIKALPDSPHKQMKYIHYTNLAYLAAVGSTAKDLRQQRGAKKDAVASDYMTATELEAVADAENRIAVLIEAGLEYPQIKRALLGRRRASA